MANGPTDPASLEGEALMRWYRRTPQQIEEEQRQTAAEAYNRFFYPTQAGQEPVANDSASDDHASPPTGIQSLIGGNSGQTDGGPSAASWAAPSLGRLAPSTPAPSPGLLGHWSPYNLSDEGNGQSASTPNYAAATNGGPIQLAAKSGPGDQTGLSDDTIWIATGSGGFRAVQAGNSNAGNMLGGSQARPDGFPEDPSAPEDADFIEIGNPDNRRLRRKQEKASGQPWPKTDDGRNYHVAHKRAIADGGTNTLDNIEPMHPDDHIAQHLNNGDSARWGKRAATARAFGGTVEPPTPGRVVRGLGLLGIIPWITGFLSGNIRTDTPVHTLYDMAGFPAPDDYDQMVDPNCRAMGINKPGEKCT